MFALSNKMNSQSGMNFSQLFPNSDKKTQIFIKFEQLFSQPPVIHWCWHTFTVGIGDNLNIPQLWHVADVLHQIISKIVRGDDQTAKVDKCRHRHHGEWSPGDVHDLQSLQGQVAHFSHLIQHVFTWVQIVNYYYSKGLANFWSWQ